MGWHGIRVAVARRFAREWLWLIAAAVLAALLGWAWYDGGERPLHEISVPITLPEPR